MKKIISKRTFVFLFLFSIGILFLMNYRIPFFKQNAGIWSVGYGISNEFPEKMEVEKNPIFSLEKLQQYIPDSEFLADPFFWKEGNKHYIFFEHKKFKPHAASIGILVSENGKDYEFKGTVLKEKFHLSYPQVFKYKNEYYMLPETQGANHVILYKAKKFPYEWEKCDTLLKNTKYKDPTIFLSDTLNIMVATDQNMTMHLFHADSLFGEWKKHQKHTVIMGSESRPGGRFFIHKNELMLPIQNASNGYGTGLSLYIFNFNNGDYSLTKDKHFYLEGNKKTKEFNAGMHHLDIQNIDGKYYYVYDGIRLLNEKKTLHSVSVFKMNYYDLKNWVHQKINN